MHDILQVTGRHHMVPCEQGMGLSSACCELIISPFHLKTVPPLHAFAQHHCSLDFSIEGAVPRLWPRDLTNNGGSQSTELLAPTHCLPD